MNIELLKLLLIHHPERIPVLLDVVIKILEPPPHYPTALRALVSDEENRNILMDAVLGIPNSIPREDLKRVMSTEALALRDELTEIKFDNLEHILQDPHVSYFTLAWCDFPDNHRRGRLMAETRERIIRHWREVVI